MNFTYTEVARSEFGSVIEKTEFGDGGEKGSSDK